jgi:hypothetical protein
MTIIDIIERSTYRENINVKNGDVCWIRLNGKIVKVTIVCASTIEVTLKQANKIIGTFSKKNIQILSKEPTALKGKAK